MTTEPQQERSSIFRVPGFRAVWIAQLVSIFGDFLALFGIISLITFRLHGTAVQVTTITIAYILPLAIFGPVAGVLVDHFNVKRTMIASDLIRGCLALLLIICSNVPQIAGVLLALSVVVSLRPGAIDHHPHDRSERRPDARECRTLAGFLPHPYRFAAGRGCAGGVAERAGNLLSRCRQLLRLSDAALHARGESSAARER
jgi:MFS family permease